MPIPITELAEKLMTGEVTVEEQNPFFPPGDFAEVADGIGFVASMANSSVFKTDDGLVMVDTGSPFSARAIHGKIRGWVGDSVRLDTAIFSHGHIDHVFGVGPFEEDAEKSGWAAPKVVAHEAMPARFDRYKLTSGWNGAINRRQFSIPGLEWPTDYRYPDETYRDTHNIEVGGIEFELHHCRGETDDHTWTWVPSRKALCTGDLVIWCSPNAGNPQKVQRYPREWAIGLREMAALEPEMLLPGHGMPVFGAEYCQMILLDTAELLEFIHDETVSLMNQGARLDEIIHSVKAPEALIEKPYLRPVYDDPEFIVRNVYRLYGGWYDGNPANLKPAPDAAVAAEVAALAGGASALIDRALALADEGELRLAGHLVEMAALAEPESRDAHTARASVNAKRVADESALMSKGVFGAASRESDARARELGED